MPQTCKSISARHLRGSLLDQFDAKLKKQKNDDYELKDEKQREKKRRSIVIVRRKRYRDGSSVVSRERIRTEKSIKEVAATMFNVNI